MIPEFTFFEGATMSPKSGGELAVGRVFVCAYQRLMDMLLTRTRGRIPVMRIFRAFVALFLM